MNDVPVGLREAIERIDPMLTDSKFADAVEIVTGLMERHGWTWEQAIEDIERDLERIRARE